MVRAYVYDRVQYKFIEWDNMLPLLTRYHNTSDKPICVCIWSPILSEIIICTSMVITDPMATIIIEDALMHFVKSWEAVRQYLFSQGLFMQTERYDKYIREAKSLVKLI